MSGSSRRIQYLPNIQRVGNFVAVGNGVALTATTGGVNAQFPTLPDGSPATDVMVVNSSTTIAAFIAFGNDTAPTVAIPVPGTPGNGIIIPPGYAFVFDKCFANFISAATAASTATIYAYQGIGS